MKKLMTLGFALTTAVNFAEIAPALRCYDAAGTVAPVDGTLTFGPGGVIEYQGNVALEPTVEAREDLTIRLTEAGETVRMYTDGVLFTRYTGEAAPVKIFENMDLDAWEPTYTIFDFNDHPSVVNISDQGFAHFVRRETLKDGRKCLYAQMQTISGFQCVKIILIQEGADVVAQTVYVRYNGKPTEADGQIDYDKSAAGYSIYNIAEAGKQNGYGVNHLYMRKVNAEPQTLTVTKRLAAAGRLTLAEGVAVKAQGPEAMTDERLYTQSLCLNGDLTFVERTRDLDFRGAIVGTNATLKVIYHPQDEVAMTTVSAADLGLEGQKMVNGTWVTLKENARLSAVVKVESKLYANKLFGYDETLSYGFRNDGEQASVLIERLPNCTQAARLQLRQNGDNVEIRWFGGWYTSGEYPDGYDFENNNATTDPNWHTWSSYYPQDWIVYFAEEREVVFGSSLKNFYGGTIKVEGLAGTRRGIVRLAELETVPAQGALALGPNIDATIPAKTVSGKDFREFNSYGSKLLVTGKSTLTSLTINPFSTWYGGGEVVFDDSVFIMDAGGRAYVNTLELRNDSRVCQHGVKTEANLSVGWQQEAKWRISGTSASTVELDMIPMLGGTTSDGKPFTLTVDDVTGDSAPDFILKARLVDNTSFPCHQLYKKGDGTIQHLSSLRHSYAPLHLQAGTWLVGVSDAFEGNTAVSLEGGTLAVAQETRNSLPALAVTASSGIDLGDGATLAFADTSAMAWPADAVVTISGDLKKSTLKFGTDGNGLTPAQVRQLRYQGGRVRLSADGTIDPGPFGLLVVIH